MKDETHLMVDIETMDVGPTAAVVAIGARLFTIDGPTKGFEVFIDPTIAQHLGTVGEDTMKWWGGQNTQSQVFGGKLDPADAVHRFIEFVEKHKPDSVWANSPGFDITILRHLCKQTNLKWPFHYRDERDCRTIFRLGTAMNVDCVGLWHNKDRQAHMPLDDATTQAEVTAKILRAIFNSPAGDSGLRSVPVLSGLSQPVAQTASIAAKTRG